MDIFSWIRLFIRNWRYTFVLPILSAIITVVATKNITRTYKSNTLIYTAVGSGFDVLSDPLDNVDRFGTIVNFDNLISTINSRSCLESTTLRLLAWRLTTKLELDTKEWNEETKLISENLSPEILKYATNHTEKETYEYLSQLFKTLSDPALVSFIEAVPSNYSIDRIRTTVQVKQKNSSDMLELIYVSNIPQVTERTLYFLTQSFRDTYIGIKSREAQKVVDYYEEQLNSVRNQLSLAEERSKNFSTENNLVNYDEQSKNIANSKENTQQQLYEQQDLKASAEKALENIEKQIGSPADVFLFNKEITPIKDRLSELNYKIGLLEISSDTATARYRSLKDEYKKLKKRSETRIRQLSAGSGSGVLREDLMTKWLDNQLDIDKSKAKINVINNRLREYDSIFKRFAPLGYTKLQLDRDAEIAQTAYKSILEKYDMSVLKLKDTELSNALSVVDTPFVPQNAQPSKRGQMVVLSALVTFLLVSAILIFVTYLDDSIKSIERIKNFTNNEVIAAVPYYEKDNTEIDWNELRRSQELNISNSILAHFSNNSTSEHTKFIGITSNYEGEGKHFMINMLEEEFTRLGFKTKSFSPKHVNGVTQYHSALLHSFLNISQAQVASGELRKSLSSSLLLDGTEDFVFFILPAFISSEIPLPLLNSLDIQLKMVDANRSWTKSDDYLHRLNQSNNDYQGMYIILNKMNPWQVEEIYGEIPRKRSVIGRFLKRLVIRLKKART